MPAEKQPDPHLILSPVEWRDMLREELVRSGFEHDAAGMIARRVIERLVRCYLGGRDENLNRAA